MLLLLLLLADYSAGTPSGIIAGPVWAMWGEYRVRDKQLHTNSFLSLQHSPRSDICFACGGCTVAQEARRLQRLPPPRQCHKFTCSGNGYDILLACKLTFYTRLRRCLASLVYACCMHVRSSGELTLSVSKVEFKVHNEHDAARTCRPCMAASVNLARQVVTRSPRPLAQGRCTAS